ncbi:MAG: Bax inhibitor-1/YccA family protein [Chthoniobacteraceae bacterium]
MRTSNPTLSPATFNQPIAAGEQRMTIQGAVNKSAILLALAIFSAVFAWNRVESAMPLILIGSIGGLIMALITTFKKEWSAVTAPIYALLEGLALGGVSALYNMQTHGIVLQAAMLTFGTLFAMLFAYRAGLIRATEKFKAGVIAATGGIFLLYLVSWILGMFGVNMAFMNGGGMLSIGISVFVVVIAALNLVLDFDVIEQGAKLGAPKYLEWYAGFGLLVTLVWLYLEILRLLAKLNSRRD